MYLTPVIAEEEAPKVRMGRMYFTPGSRTAWHSHTGGEYLHVLEGTALVQERDGNVSTLEAGDIVYIDPNTEHWHGAPPDSLAILLATWGAPEDDGEHETRWSSHVTDEEAEPHSSDEE